MLPPVSRGESAALKLPVDPRIMRIEGARKHEPQVVDLEDALDRFRRRKFDDSLNLERLYAELKQASEFEAALLEFEDRYSSALCIYNDKIIKALVSGKLEAFGIQVWGRNARQLKFSFRDRIGDMPYYFDVCQSVSAEFLRAAEVDFLGGVVRSDSSAYCLVACDKAAILSTFPDEFVASADAVPAPPKKRGRKPKQWDIVEGYVDSVFEEFGEFPKIEALVEEIRAFYMEETGDRIAPSTVRNYLSIYCKQPKFNNSGN